MANSKQDAHRAREEAKASPRTPNPDKHAAECGCGSQHQHRVGAKLFLKRPHVHQRWR